MDVLQGGSDVTNERSSIFSLRLADGIRTRLEQIRQRWELSRGSSTSIADVVQGLLARPLNADAVLTAADLSLDPAASLSMLASRGPADTLAQGEWLYVAELVHALARRGIGHGLARYQYDDWQVLFAALRAVMALVPKSGNYDWYFSTLGGATDVAHDGSSSPLVELATRVGPQYTLAGASPEFPARVLYFALRDEILSEPKLDAALRCYREGLVRLAIREHVMGGGSPLLVQPLITPTLRAHQIAGLSVTPRIAEDGDLEIDLIVLASAATVTMTVKGFSRILDTAHGLAAASEPPYYWSSPGVDCSTVPIAGKLHVVLAWTSAGSRMTLTEGQASDLRQLLRDMLLDPDLATSLPSLQMAYGE
jgi:hypothetical protein